MTVFVCDYAATMLALLGVALGVALRSTWPARGVEMGPSPMPLDPEFGGVFAKPFEPIPRPFDIDVTFDKIVGAEIARKLDVQAKKIAEDEEHDAKLDVIRQAFKRMIDVRKPMVASGATSSPLSFDEDKGSSLLSKGARIRFYIRQSGYVFILVGYCRDKGYEVDLRCQAKHCPTDHYKDWRKAYERALEHLSPYIVSYEGSPLSLKGGGR